MRSSSSPLAASARALAEFEDAPLEQRRRIRGASSSSNRQVPEQSGLSASRLSAVASSASSSQLQAASGAW